MKNLISFEIAWVKGESFSDGSLYEAYISGDEIMDFATVKNGKVIESSLYIRDEEVIKSYNEWKSVNNSFKKCK